MSGVHLLVVKGECLILLMSLLKASPARMWTQYQYSEIKSLVSARARKRGMLAFLWQLGELLQPTEKGQLL